MFEQYKNEILKFYRTHKRMPVYREIATLLGFKSTNAAYRLVNKLIDEGVVTKDKKGKLIPNKLFGEVPMLGLVTAGFPAMVEAERFDSMSLDDFMIEKKETTFMLEVDGDSMIEAHIADEMRMTGNAISGENALSVALNEKDYWDQVREEVGKL